MAQKFVLTDFPAPAVNAREGIHFRYADRNLLVGFRDAMNNGVHIRFNDVLGIRWSQDEQSRTKLRDDKVYEVHDSKWIRQIKRAGTISKGLNEYRHLKIGFNESGSFLEVVFKGRAKMEHGTI